MNILIKFFLYIAVLSSFSLYGYGQEKTENQMPLEEKNTLSLEDKHFVDEYNKISEYLVNGNEQEFRKQLKLFLPKAIQIKNDQQRNNILMNIYLQNEQYQQAYDLNEKLLAQKPKALNREIFRCQLYEMMKKIPVQISNCYENSAQKVKNELTKISESDPQYLEGKFTYNLLLYRAGHHEYKQKMQELIKLIPDETVRSRFQNYYELTIEETD